jgi:hypothetical protein
VAAIVSQITGGRPKTQSLQYRNGYAVPLPLHKEQDAAALQQEFAQMWTLPPAPSAATATISSSFEPKYVKFDKKVRQEIG